MATLEHPRSVLTGVSILYISLILGFVGGIIDIIHIWNGLPSLNIADTTPPFGVGAMWGIILVSTAIGWFIISQINKGKNWARILYAVLTVIGLILWSTKFEMTLAQGAFALIAALINTFLGIIGSICLFTPSANAWFKLKIRCVDEKEP